MNNPTGMAITLAQYGDGLTPQIVHHVSEDEMYIGYCTPDCTSESDGKWLIKHVITDGEGIQTIYFAEGSKLFNKQWSKRTEYNYKPTEVWA